MEKTSPQLEEKVKTDKVSGRVHTLTCVIRCVSLDFILALLVGHDECVCVCVCVQTRWQDNVRVVVCSLAQTGLLA